MTAARTPMPGLPRRRARHHGRADLTADQPAGRHRHSRRRNRRHSRRHTQPRIPPSSSAPLLFEFAADSQFSSHPLSWRPPSGHPPSGHPPSRHPLSRHSLSGHPLSSQPRPARGPARGRRMRLRFAMRRFGRRIYGGRPAAVRWALTVAVPPLAAGVAVAVLAGYVLMRSSGTGGEHGAIPGITPQVSAPATVPVSPQASAAPRPHAVRWTAMPTSSARPAGQAPAPAKTVPAAPARTSAASAPPKPAIVVTYRVNTQGSSGFQGEIEVTNNGAEPIGDWEIVVSLPADKVVSVSNASGFVSNGILLLQPGTGEPAIPASGGTLHIFFVALGLQEVPDACAFDGITCRYG
jgi:hypothetical protein